MNTENVTFEEARDYILGIPKFTGKNSIEDTQAFYRYLGCPGGGSRIIHVAGTNGKGSVCAFLNSVLQVAGFHTGLFTSPHLISICERFRLDGECVSEETFGALFSRLKAMVLEYQKAQDTQYHPSFFEFVFFMAMLWYEDCKPDYIVLETGLGGRLDATNIVDSKVACVITRLGMDHMEYLGDTLEKIAGEKAGIIRPNTPIITLTDPYNAFETVRNVAQELGAPCYPVEKEDISFCQNTDKGIDFCIYSRYYENVTVHLPTIARYQAENAAIAVKTIENLPDRDRITAEMLKEGLCRMVWEGRMEEIRPGVYLDGAHNTDGIRAFLETVADDGFIGRRELLFAVVRDKQYDEMVRMLSESGLFQEVHVTKVAGSREVAISQIQGMFEQYTDCPVSYYEDIELALHNVLAHKGSGDRIYIAGSLYLVGSVREILQGQES